MIAKANQLASAVSAGIRGVTGGAPAGDPSIPAMPMASGGTVRGPGSSTSDSILARLSNGEFVMQARAVEHWGPRFMAALNGLQNPFGFAQGGLVPRFAAGGPVAAERPCICISAGNPSPSPATTTSSRRWSLRRTGSRCARPGSSLAGSRPGRDDLGNHHHRLRYPIH
jgi:hypothetical protein